MAEERTKTCLIVDNSRVIRMVVRRILEDLGFAADETSDGKAALDRCKAAMPDAVLLDLNLPKLSGIEFLRALRRSEGGNRPVVVFCTAEGDAAHMEEALSEGADEYIVKPFDSEIFHAKLTQVGLL
jgi:two-component system chemotaxis response regulator CheY